MTVGYEKTSPSPFTAADTFEASEFNGELNLVTDAFDATTGHDHDGAAGKGPNVDINDFVGFNDTTTGYLSIDSVTGGFVARTLESDTLEITNPTGVAAASDFDFIDYGIAGNYTDISVTVSSSGIITAISSGNVIPTGLIMPMFTETAPTGWIRLNGKTITEGGGSGTERANADCEDLYTHLWNNLDNTAAPVSTGRGASAAADFAAGKTLTLPDLRGRMFVGLNAMGNSSSGRISSSATSGLNAGSGDTPGTWGTTNVAQTFTLSSTHLPGHAHTVNIPGGPATDFSGSAESVLRNITTLVGNFTTTATGGGAAHNNMPPFMLIGWMIKL